jgi:hypothetical protein
MPAMEISEMKEMNLLRPLRFPARVYRRPTTHSKGKFSKKLKTIFLKGNPDH